MPNHEIEMSSRYGNAEEMKEMEDFATDIAEQGFAHCVSSMFYDSQACICIIETVGTADQLGDEAVAALAAGAMRHIGQYELFGMVGQKGGPPPEERSRAASDVAREIATFYQLQIHPESLLNESVASFESTTPFQALCIGDKYTPPNDCDHWFPGVRPKVTYITDKSHFVIRGDDLQIHLVQVAVSLTK